MCFQCDLDDPHLFFPKETEISTKIMIICYFTIYLGLAIVSQIIGVISFQDQLTVWSEYSSGFNDDELINEQCNDSYGKFSKITIDRGDEQVNDPGTKRNGLLILYYIQLTYVIVLINVY